MLAIVVGAGALVRGTAVRPAQARTAQRTDFDRATESLATVRVPNQSGHWVTAWTAAPQEPVSGNLSINHEQSAQYKRTSEVASFQQSGADRKVGSGLTEAFVDRPGRMPDFEAKVPKKIKQIFDDLLRVRGPLVRQ